MGKKYTNFTINFDGVDDKEQWYAVITNYNYEKFVINRLNFLNTNLGREVISEVFTPIQLITTKTKKNGIEKIKVKEENIMPSYVFIKTTLNLDMWKLIMNITGIRCIMCTAGMPTAISEDEIIKTKKLMEQKIV